MRAPYALGIDTGGTFTDFSLVGSDGDITFCKADSTPPNFAEGILTGLDLLARTAGHTPAELSRVTDIWGHGMTVALNTILRRAGARVGVLTTKGFEDTLSIMKARGKALGKRPEEIRQAARLQKPEPLVPEERVAGITERVDSFGNVVVPLNEEEARQAIRFLIAERGCEALAICTLWAFSNPVHEKRLAEICQELYPDLPVSLSHQIAPRVGEYERTVTTAMDAYIKGETANYLGRLEGRIGSRLTIMQANGGTIPVSLARTLPVLTVGAGPAGGVVACRSLGKELGIRNIVTADVGGTSFDVSVLENLEPTRADDLIVYGYRARLPRIAIESVGAGGGSIVRVDPLSGRLRVGPDSAGASPGPACYGRGGTQLTLTDVDVLLGVLDPAAFAGGTRRLHPELARSAAQPVASALKMSVEELCWSARQIACESMADLVKNQVVLSGFDPRDFTIFAFGGAGAQFASMFTMAAQMDRVVLLRLGPVLSALGIAMAERTFERARPSFFREPFALDQVRSEFERLEVELHQVLQEVGASPDGMRIEREVRCRYGRQVNDVAIPVDFAGESGQSPGRLIRDFEERYEALFGAGAGHRSSGVEITESRIRAVFPSRNIALRPIDERPAGRPVATRRVYLGQWLDAPVFRWEDLGPNQELIGPALVQGPFSTGLLLPGHEGRVDPFLNIHITCAEER